MGIGGAERPECPSGELAVTEGHQIDLGQPALGERPGLVDADHIDPGQRLDRGQLLHEDPLLRQPQRGHGEGDAGEQDQALGHHGPDGRHRAPERLPQALVGRELAPDEQDRGGDDQPGDDPQDGVGPLPQLGAHQLEAAGLAGQAVGVGVDPHRHRPDGSRPGHHHRARQQAIALDPLDGIGLAAEQRLVDLEAGGVQHDGVDRHLLPGGDLEDVVEDEVVR